MKIHQIIFSPTGGTRRVSETLCRGIDKESVVTDLCVKAADIQLPNIQEDDLAVIALPVFAGRVPALAVERLRMVNPHGAKCVVVAVYGNRAYDDALLEMQDVATEMGFRVIAAVGAVAEHSIIRKYGKGRPDADDEQTLRRFAADKVQTALCQSFQATVLTRKAARCHTPKEDADAIVVAFAPDNVQPMPFHYLTPKRLILPSAYPA